jgi:hypothetical protein
MGRTLLEDEQNFAIEEKGASLLSIYCPVIYGA